MGKSREMESFTWAKSIRETLIGQLKKCNSLEALERFLKKFNDKQKGRSTTNLTVFHQGEIKKLDAEIDELIKNLRKRFAQEARTEIIPTSSDQPEMVSAVVEKNSSLNSTSLAEPGKKHPPQLNEHKIEVSLEKDKGGALLSTQTKSPLKGIQKTKIEKEKSSIADQNKKAVTFLISEDHQQHKKTLSDNKLPQVTSVDYRIMRQRNIQLFDVDVKLRAIYTKLGIYQAKEKKYKEQKNYKEASKYRQAAQAATSIYNQISALKDTYLRDGDLVTFKSKSQEVLGDEKSSVKTLRTHRGWWEKFLDDLVNLINTGLDRAGSSVHLPKLSLFKPLADGGKKVTELNNSISSLKA
ncbi:hypothetical protein [Legionella sp. PC997]|uniref:hypothetical protein n=1 Tax=Legionella sp. PC997 TaxID=2755562 RepID=UPI0015F86800|nr:hypothetical protein [Legionella sp. PC997]QMT60814.1 hypothetical protein HBNCFIEN_02199 [Legionella sp. PC997]